MAESTHPHAGGKSNNGVETEVNQECVSATASELSIHPHRISLDESARDSRMGPAHETCDTRRRPVYGLLPSAPPEMCPCLLALIPLDLVLNPQNLML